MIGRRQLCQLIPHAGRMCLLDEVLSWDRQRIHCRSYSHRLADNPLSDENGLAGIHAVEYAAQSMAVHGALLAQDAAPAAGFIAALKDVRVHVDDLRQLEHALEVHSEALLIQSEAMIYRFTVSAGKRSVAQGRITVMNQRQEFGDA